MLRAFPECDESRKDKSSWEAILQLPECSMPPDERPELTQYELSAHSIYENTAIRDPSESAAHLSRNPAGN